VQHTSIQIIKMFSRAVSRSTITQGWKQSYGQVRHSSSLKKRFEELIPIKQKEIKEIKEKYGEKLLGNCTVNQAYGGMRDVRSMVYETSLLDANEGIRFRGLTIPEVQQKLPKFKNGSEPMPEGLLWLLLTGEIPTQAQVQELSQDLLRRATVPSWISDLQKKLPKDMHPMTQFNIAINALQTDSLFAKAYQDGVNKTKYWDTTYEDSLNLVARLPQIAATIYRHTYKDGQVAALDNSLDWSGNFAKMLGYKDPMFAELMRLYMVIHSDH